MTNPLDTEYLSANDVLMMPQEGICPSRSDALLNPFVFSAPMDTVTGYKLAKAMLEQGEYAVVSRFIPEEERFNCLAEFRNHPRCFFAVGLGADWKKFQLVADPYILSDKDPKLNIALDIAHGDMEKAHEFTRKIRTEYSGINHIMSGSICTGSAALRAVRAGCDYLRVGVGPGAACTTRIKTGCGFPQLSAVYLINKTLNNSFSKYVMSTTEGRRGIKIIADGGIKESGDAAKYIGAGADGIMMGSVFSKTLESAGWEEVPMSDQEWRQVLQNQIGAVPFPTPPAPIQFVKAYRGQASAEFQNDMFGEPGKCPEGASSAPFKWDLKTTVATVLDEFRGGIQSSISYLGFDNIRAMQPENITWIKITTATYMEGTPHGV